MARSRYIDDSTVCGISQEQDFMLLSLGPSRLSLSRAVPFDSCNRCQSQQQDPKPTSVQPRRYRHKVSWSLLFSNKLSCTCAGTQVLVFLSTKGDAFPLSSSHGTIYGFIISGCLRTTSLSVSIPALCPKVDMTTLSNYCSSSAASRHLRTILPGRRNERIEHVGQVERAL